VGVPWLCDTDCFVDINLRSVLFTHLHMSYFTSSDPDNDLKHLTKYEKSLDYHSLIWVRQLRQHNSLQRNVQLFHSTVATRVTCPVYQCVEDGSCWFILTIHHWLFPFRVPLLYEFICLNITVCSIEALLKIMKCRNVLLPRTVGLLSISKLIDHPQLIIQHGSGVFFFF
jgi:hypothetical protein